MLTLPAPVVNALQLAGRLIFAYIFISSGFGKLMSQDASVGYIASGGLPFPVELAYWGAVVAERMIADFDGPWGGDIDRIFSAYALT